MFKYLLTLMLLPIVVFAQDYKFEKLIFSPYSDNVFALMKREDDKYQIWLVNEISLEMAQEFFEDYNFDEENYSIY